MANKKTRKLLLPSQTKKGRIVSAPLSVNKDNEIVVERVVYRDGKNKLSKFTTRKKLKPIVVFTQVRRDPKTGKLKKFVWESKRHRGPLKKWKRPKTKDQMIRKIETRLKREKKSFVVTVEDGITRIGYPKKRR